jgi:thioredoxin-dependent peroxiredoxin
MAVKKAKKTKKKSAVKAVKKVSKKTAKKVSKKATKKVVKKTISKSTAPASLPMVGTTAPTFTLNDQNGKSISLESFRGSKVLIYFYPKAMTPGCTVQACSLRDSKKELQDNNIVVLGISGDPQKALKKFEDRDKLNFTLLSDPDHKISEAYGSWGLKKFMGREYMGILRQSFLIDSQGKLVHIMNKVDTKTHHDEVLKFFKSLG